MTGPEILRALADRLEARTAHATALARVEAEIAELTGRVTSELRQAAPAVKAGAMPGARVARTPPPPRIPRPAATPDGRMTLHGYAKLRGSSSLIYTRHAEALRAIMVDGLLDPGEADRVLVERTGALTKLGRAVRLAAGIDVEEAADASTGEADDDDCPKSDPECLGDNGDCHDACEAPASQPGSAAPAAGLPAAPPPPPAKVLGLSPVGSGKLRAADEIAADVLDRQHRVGEPIDTTTLDLARELRGKLRPVETDLDKGRIGSASAAADFLRRRDYEVYETAGSNWICNGKILSAQQLIDKAQGIFDRVGNKIRKRA